MTCDGMIATARELVIPGKGILAADDGFATMNERLSEAGVPADERHRRAFRELIVTTPGLNAWISGVILCDETFRQTTAAGKAIPDAAAESGIIPGIKVDLGTKPLMTSDQETVTQGLDGLADRLAEYVSLGARFAKWRAVFRIGGGMPTRHCVSANAHALARYALLCQEAGVVPIIEPEVLMDGRHTLVRCEEITTEVLHAVLIQLRTRGVALESIVLKPNMVVPGNDCHEPASAKEVADSTLRCLSRTVPTDVPGVAFLSGGQSDEAATLHLDVINRRSVHPWELTFSFGRALLTATLSDWAGEDRNVRPAQETLAHRARCNAAARNGQFSIEMEEERAESAM